MTKKELIDVISQDCGCTKVESDKMISKVFETIKDSLVKGEEVAIPGFGKFSVSDRAARQGRNPSTGETIQIPASKAAKFKVAKQLKEAIN